MARKKTEDVEEGAPQWVLTYGDMMSLLLTFFILLVSFSTIQETKYEQAAGSLRSAFGGMPKISGSSRIASSLKGQRGNSDEMIEEVQEMKKAIADKQMQEQIKVTLTEKGAHIVIADPLLFDLGKANLKPQAKDALDIVAALITRSPNTEIIVEGHTDNWPIATSEFPSNWELSAARALAVVKYFALRKGFDPARFAATGYGEYHPVKSNDTPENRTKNRRVEIFVNTKSNIYSMESEIEIDSTAN